MQVGRLIIGVAVVAALMVAMRTLDDFQATPDPVTLAGHNDVTEPLSLTQEHERRVPRVLDEEEVPLPESTEGHSGQEADISMQDQLALLAYLHLKLGETDNDPSALQLQDLTYLGQFEQDEGIVHYWLMPHEGNWDRYATATVVGDHQLSFSLSSSAPPALSTSDQPPMEPDPGTEKEPSFFAWP